MIILFSSNELIFIFLLDIVKQAESYEANELFDIKNSYYIGNYQQCINDAQKEPVFDVSIINITYNFYYLQFDCNLQL